MSFGPQEICRDCGRINYEGRIVCRACDVEDDILAPSLNERQQPVRDGSQL